MSDTDRAQVSKSSPLRTLREHGPLAVLCGMYFAGRPDVLSADEIAPLLLLADEYEPCSWADIRQTIADDLGAPVEELFDWINTAPDRAGALTQRHRARLVDGTAVSVKVVRPDAPDRLANATAIDTAVRSLVPGADATQRALLVDEVKTWLALMVDLDEEAAATTRLHNLDLDGFRFPKPWPELCGPRVFTSSLMSGVRVVDLLPRSDGGARPTAELGIDIDALAADVVNATMAHVFSLRAFPRAPAPDSLVALPSGEIGVLDVTSVDRIDVSVHDRHLAFVSAVRSGDLERTVPAAERLVGSHRDDGRAFRSDYLEAAKEVNRTHEIKGGSGTPVADHWRAVARSAHRNGHPIDREVLASLGSLLAADQLSQMLDTDAGMRPTAERVFLRQQIRAAFGHLGLDQAQALALDVFELITTSPRHLGQVLSSLADGRFQLNVATTESDTDRRAGVARARLISAAIVLAALAIVVTGPDIAGGGTVLKVGAYVLLSAATLGFAWLWVRLR